MTNGRDAGKSNSTHRSSFPASRPANWLCLARQAPGNWVCFVCQVVWNWLCFAWQPRSGLSGWAMPTIRPASQIGFVSHDRSSTPAEPAQKLALFRATGPVCSDAVRRFCGEAIPRLREGKLWPCLVFQGRDAVATVLAGTLQAHEEKLALFCRMRSSASDKQGPMCFPAMRRLERHGASLAIARPSELSRYCSRFAIQLCHYHIDA